MRHGKALTKCVMITDLNIRTATAKDARPISKLILAVANYFTVNPHGEGADDFLKTIQPQEICRYISAENFIYMVAEINVEIGGVVGLRDHKHLYHLFVAPQHQRKGIARALWENARDKAIAAGNIEGFTVNSTRYAVPVYERFGFIATGPIVETHGIAFVPMKLTLGN
jgi:GNAT superfamily N-acetyltransferase